MDRWLLDFKDTDVLSGCPFILLYFERDECIGG